MHKKDRDLLDQIKNYFGVGVISKHGEKLNNYGVKSIKDIQLIINHFDKYSLVGDKLINYEDFKRVSDLMARKSHLTKEGLDEILAIKSNMNFNRK